MNDKRLYHQVAEQIKQLIQDGAYPSGSRLPGERELAEQFDVSRVTVREAEIALQALGYLGIKTGSGVYVMEPGANANQTIPEVSAFELTEARSLFESEAAALAARVIDDETLELLQELIETMSSDNPADEEASQRADQDFHLAIAAASGNAAVQHTIENLWKMRTGLPAIRNVHEAICANEEGQDRRSEHEEVLRALRNRDASGAREAMRAHFTRLLGSMIDITEEMALTELRNKASASRQRYLNGAESGTKR